MGRRMIRLLPFVVVVVAVECLSNKSSTNRRSSTTTRNHNNCRPQSIQNPLTKRRIRLDGPTFNDFLKQGAWVQHQGTLKRLDLEKLREYQQHQQQQQGSSSSSSSGENIACYRDDSEGEPTEQDEWYCITPSVISSHGSETTTSMPNNDELLFVHKPAGLNCVPARDLSIDSLSAQIALLYPNAKPCHRLDRDTSGIVVFGLTAASHADISKQFELKTSVSKTYTALVAGHPPAQQDSGTIDMPIGKTRTQEGFNRWTLNGGEKQRQAITKWRLDETFTVEGAEFSRLELQPQTGRGHQLRLHCKALGCPILGDTIHGDAAVATCSPRLCLHAGSLQVDWNGMRLQAESVAPF